MSAPPELPPLVSAALSLSGRRGFVSSTRNETGRLLASLAASKTGLLGELGTGCGVGSAFALLFVDAREAKLSARDIIADVVEPGGFVVLDDFTPSAVWPPMYEGRVDTLRQEWLMDKRFTTVEVMVAPDAAVLLATRH